MTPEALLKTGDLDGALAAVEGQVRADPTAPKLRVLLFQVLCLTGAWERAVQQLRTLVRLQPEAETFAQVYRAAIRGEVAREHAFAGTRPPVFADPEANWLPVMWDALTKEVGGDRAGANALRAMALRAAPAVPGTVNGAAFDWIADADPRLGPVLEIIMGGDYQWLPFASVAEMTVQPPGDLRDLVWAPATLRLTDGREAVGLIPARYPLRPGATAAEALSRQTHWIEAEGRTIGGAGQRMLCTESDDLAFLELRDLRMGPAQPERLVRHG